MVISDKYQFYFVHIPKCAGTSVRKSLEPYYDQPIAHGLIMHPILGLFDYNHIPLTVLRAHFPEEYKKLRAYHSFAVMRDPYSRFPSSLKQRLGMHKNRKIKTLTKKEIQTETDETINLLLKHQDSELLPADLIHFQKQKHFIYDGNQKLVKSIYHIGELEYLFIDLEKMFGLSFNHDNVNNKNNTSPLVYKNELFEKLDKNTKAYRRDLMAFLPLSLKKAIKLKMKAHPKELDVFNSNYVKSFLEDFYKEDISLYQALLGNNETRVT